MTFLLFGIQIFWSISILQTLVLQDIIIQKDLYSGVSVFWGTYVPEYWPPGGQEY